MVKMTEDNIISLFVVGQKFDRTAFYRVADFDIESGTFDSFHKSAPDIKFVYSQNSFPSYIDENYYIGELMLRTWWYKSYENGTIRTFSKPLNNVMPIELIFIDEIYNARLEREQLLKKLREGMAFDEHTSEKMLLFWKVLLIIIKRYI